MNRKPLTRESVADLIAQAEAAKANGGHYREYVRPFACEESANPAAAAMLKILYRPVDFPGLTHEQIHEEFRKVME